MKIIAYLQFKFNGYSTLNRNFGNKLALNIPVKNNLMVKDYKKNYYFLDSNNNSIKLLKFYFRDLDKFVNSSYFDKNQLSLASYLPVTPIH